MRVLNFAHGAFFTVAAYAGWSASRLLAGSAPEVRWAVAVLVAIAIGGAFAALTEVLLIRPLYSRHVGQVLVTWAWRWRPSRSCKAVSAATRSRSRCRSG